ncbi:MAG TPA: cell wall-binding repeat-containing protein [Egibacteraceae bacterium]|nr:cell wall-binding repeat-containing protein [Egibacteraceae bacterium]
MTVSAVMLAAPLGSAQSSAASAPPVVSERIDGLPSDLSGGQSPMALQSAGALSAPVKAPIAFSLVGFGAPMGAEVEFRTSNDGKTWADWAEAHHSADEAPDPVEASGQMAPQQLMSEPYWVERASWLQLRVQGAAPEDVEVHLIDSAGLSRSLAGKAADSISAAFRGAGQPAAATVGAPAIVTRAQWGADESIREGSPSHARRARVGFVHHTAGTNDYSASSSPAIVRGIYHYHVQSRGWSDIGYNLLVDRFGTVFEGRYGGVDKAVIGAHAGGFNTGSFGVSLMGTFDGGAPPSAAMQALAEVLAWKFDVHHIDAGATVQVESLGSTRYAKGTKVNLSTVSGHRDVSLTACPGGSLYSLLPDLRRSVLDLASSMFIDPEVSPLADAVAEDDAAKPFTFSTRLRPSGSWNLKVSAPDGAIVHTAKGSGATAASTWQPPAGADYGRYTFAFSASGRRTAQGYFDLVKPLVDVLDRVGARSDPVSAAVDVSKLAFPEAAGTSHAVLARSDVFADAMAGGPLAGADGPVLLTARDALDSRVDAELERVLRPDGTVFVLGGSAAISDAVVATLEQRWNVVRLGGRERTETAAAVAGAVLERSGKKTVLLARAGPDPISPWADALAGGAYGAANGLPVLLTDTDKLSAAAAAALKDLGITSTIVLGGEAAISAEVASAVPGPTRVQGRDRSETAAAIASRLWNRRSAGDGDRFIVTGGYRQDAWALALIASPLAAQQGAPVLLLAADSVPPGTRDYLDGLGYGTQRMGAGWVLGPQAAVSDSTVQAVSALLQ